MSFYEKKVNTFLFLLIYEGDYYKSIDSSKTSLALRSDLAKLITDTHKNYTTNDGLAKVYKTTDVAIY